MLDTTSAIVEAKKLTVEGRTELLAAVAAFLIGNGYAWQGGNLPAEDIGDLENLRHHLRELSEKLPFLDVASRQFGTVLDWGFYNVNGDTGEVYDGSNSSRKGDMYFCRAKGPMLPRLGTEACEALRTDEALRHSTAAKVTIVKHGSDEFAPSNLNVKNAARFGTGKIPTANFR